jgi:autotransporter adhesin
VAANSTAIGNGARANFAGDVALGAGSVTSAANPTISAQIGGDTYGGFAGTNPTSVVSVGAPGSERQIINVAAGRISPTSTDAINGSQVYSITEALSDRMNSGIAAASAMGSIPMPTTPGAWSIGGAFGFWEGSQGYAIGLGKMTPDGRWTFRATGAMGSNGEGGGTVAFGIQF